MSSKRTQESDRALPSAHGLTHRHPMLYALIFITLLSLSSGCTSSRLMKSKGFAWLGDKEDGLNLQSESFPPPSALEVPRSVSRKRASGSGQAAPGLVAGNPSSVPSGLNRSVAPLNAQTPNAPNPNIQNPLVQSGLYGNGQIDNGAIPAPSSQVITLPPPAASVQPESAAAPPPATITQAIPTSSPAYLQAAPAPLREQPVTNQPLNSLGGNSAYPGMQVSANEPIAPTAPVTPSAPEPIATPEHVTPIPLPATPPLTANVSPPTNGSTYYQEQATQPRPWRPGSTSDFDQNAGWLKTPTI